VLKHSTVCVPIVATSNSIINVAHLMIGFDIVLLGYQFCNESFHVLGLLELRCQILKRGRNQDSQSLSND